jgi:hypothetical protein
LTWWRVKKSGSSKKDEREEVLDKYAGIVKLGRTVKLEEILVLGEDRWQ